MGADIFNLLSMMTKTKVVVPTMLDNIWRILEYTGVPMKMFLVNFGLENFNWMLAVEPAEEASEEGLR